MSYGGYRLMIGSTTVKNKWMAPNSYHVQKKPRVVGTWKDADQVEHRELCGTKCEITFSLRERSATDQATMATILTTLENLSVTYWNDISATYETGTFYMDAPNISSRMYGDSLIYDATQIKLTEY